MMKAMVGTLSGVFDGGSNKYSWGGGDDPSWLSFSSAGNFDTFAGNIFSLGTLTFHNGVISGTNPEFNSASFGTSFNFTNVSEKNFTNSNSFLINNTLNTGTPEENADSVALSGYNYKFNVYEGSTSSVNLYATLTTGLSLGSVSASGDAFPSVKDQSTSPEYKFSFAGFGTPTPGGFITGAVPEPATWAMMICGFCMIGSIMRRLPLSRKMAPA